MQISADDYPALKAFFVWACEHLMPPSPGLPPEYLPVAVIEGFEGRSKATARKGLALAIGDLIEMSSELTAAQVASIDEALKGAGIVTLTEVRARFWSRIRRIRRRGLVRNEEEYYALRNVVETLSADEQAKARELLAAYEEKAVGQ